MIPAGELVTVPLPVPAVVIVFTRLTESVKVVGVWSWKVAVQDLLTSIVTEPSEQSAFPVQPEKIESDAGVAVNATAVPVE